jgi:hypothetical protein
LLLVVWLIVSFRSSPVGGNGDQEVGDGNQFHGEHHPVLDRRTIASGRDIEQGPCGNVTAVSVLRRLPPEAGSPPPDASQVQDKRRQYREAPGGDHDYADRYHVYSASHLAGG